MKKRYFSSLLLLTLGCFPFAAQAQSDSTYEIGGLGLITFYTAVDVSGDGESGSVGPKFGPAGGFILGQNLSGRWGGEFRYLYFQNDLKLESGGEKAEFGARSHGVHYDLLYYFSDSEERVRPFVAAGIGVKFYQGTGTEQPFQPLSHLALLTKTSQTMFMGDVGAGVKFKVKDNVFFRIEFRDYITAVPTKVIAAAPGAKLDGLLHHWAPLFGVTWIF